MPPSRVLTLQLGGRLWPGPAPGQGPASRPSPNPDPAAGLSAEWEGTVQRIHREASADAQTAHAAGAAVPLPWRGAPDSLAAGWDAATDQAVDAVMDALRRGAERVDALDGVEVRVDADSGWAAVWDALAPGLADEYGRAAVAVFGAAPAGGGGDGMSASGRVCAAWAVAVSVEEVGAQYVPLDAAANHMAAVASAVGIVHDAWDCGAAQLSEVVAALRPDPALRVSGLLLTPPSAPPVRLSSLEAWRLPKRARSPVRWPAGAAPVASVRLPSADSVPCVTLETAPAHAAELAASAAAALAAGPVRGAEPVRLEAYQEVLLALSEPP